jgi:hypothetical protein
MTFFIPCFLMKRFADLPILFLLVYLPCINASVSARENQKHVFSGTLVDITCATDPKRNLSQLRSEHTRKCLLMPVCAESGYALLTDHDDVLRFDAAGNELARKLIEQNSRSHHWQVSVEGILAGDHLSVQHIKLRANELTPVTP